MYSISIILWAAIIGYSRIYLGVHYPGDVLLRFNLGSFVGWGAISSMRSLIISCYRIIHFLIHALSESRVDRSFFNLAVDEYFFKNKKENYLILGVNSSSVIIGKHQVLTERQIHTLFTKIKFRS